MKFFDLEMDGCLARVSNKKGGRDISWPVNKPTKPCSVLKFTHGYSYDTCGANTYKDPNNSWCETTFYIELK